MGSLAECGLDVSQGEDDRLAIRWPGARCTLAVSEHGTAEWEYCPKSPAGADPGLAADMATALLTGRLGPFSCLAGSRENLTFKGAVGRELRARGLDVELAMYADEVAFAAFAEVVATAPGGAEEAQVRVADDGGLTWIRDYEAGPAGPGSCPAADPASIAADVVETVARAVTCLRAAVAPGPGVSAS
jgi:hypothetical protein